MKRIHHNQFVEFSLDEQASIINDVWTIETAKMSEAEFKENLKMWRDLCIKYKIKLALVDTTNMLFVIAPTLQEWIVENIDAPVWANGLKRIAFLAPEDFVAGLSIEQVAEEQNGSSKASKAISRYFISKEQAMQWLLSK